MHTKFDPSFKIDQKLKDFGFSLIPEKEGEDALRNNEYLHNQ